MGTNDNFRIRVLTPAGLVLDEETDSVKIPSIDGEIGVLPMHTKYSGLLGHGVLEFTGPSGVRRLTINGGLSQFSRKTLTILADKVEDEAGLGDTV